MASPSNNDGGGQIIIAVIAGAIWLFNAVMAKTQQGKKKTEEPEEQPDNAPAANTPLTEADRRYREIQEEIRRRVAQRTNPSAPVPHEPGKMALPPFGRPSALSKPTQRRRTAPSPPPASVSVDSDDARMAMPAAPAQPWTQNLMEASRASDVRAVMARPTDESAAYAQTDDRPQPGAALRAALTAPGAARQAFLFREIFDRPLCLRPGPGGHEDFNF